MKSAAEMRKIAKDFEYIEGNHFIEQLEKEIEAQARNGKTVINYYGHDAIKVTKYVVDILMENGYKVYRHNDCYCDYYVEILW